MKPKPETRQSKETEIRYGKEIDKIRTRKTIYDNDCITIDIGAESYYLKVDTLIPLLKQHKFNVVKKTKHNYLIPHWNPDYKSAFHELMEYWDSLPDEAKPELNKKLKEFGV